MAAAIGRVLLLAIMVAPMTAHSQETAASLEFFEKRVRPVLAQQCFSCHGPEHQKAGLRLDHISTMLSGGDNGPALIPGDPDASRLIRAIQYNDITLEMPPRGKLPDDAIRDLIAWVAMGAPWPDEPLPDRAGPAETFDLEARRASHWAWQPMRHVDPPPVRDRAWPRKPLDRYVLAKLDEAGFKPAPQAPAAVLLRRLHYDLTGLPPTADAVANFLSGDPEKEYDALVDTLLASQPFGEHWARHWLDITRYAETYGQEQDFTVEHAWQYRDYVIRALNDDVPYDQLVVEHIAGDLLDTPRRNPAHGFNESIIGTGFWHMHQAQHAPVDVRLDHAERVDNQIDVMSKAFLAMTVSCARCHDHKFDAISTEDYYALAGVLRSSRRQVAYLDPGGAVRNAARELKDRHAQGTASLQARLDTGVDDGLDLAAYVREVFAGCESGSNPDLDAARLAHWMDAVSPDNAFTNVSADSTLFEDFSEGFSGWYVSGEAFGDEPLGAHAWVPAPAAVQFAPVHTAHSGRYAPELRGVLRSPSFTLEHEHLHFLAAGRTGQIRLIIENYAIRQYHPLLFNSTFLDVNHGDAFRWVEMSGGLDKYLGCRAHLEFVDDGDGYIAIKEIRFADAPLQKQHDPQSMYALLQSSASSSVGDAAQLIDAAVRTAMDNWSAGRAAPGDIALLNTGLYGWLDDGGPIAAELYATLGEMARIGTETPEPMRVLAMADGSGFDAPVFVRGSPHNPGKPVPRRFIEAAAGYDQPPLGSGSGRLDLAHRMLSDENPLPARVIVNRVWHHLFGEGIVPTVDDFGVLGLPPTHPELLDYLALEFMANGWSLKWLIRELVTSSTYRMSSKAHDPIAEAHDPEVTLLHRMRVRRLPAESIRDGILAVAGTLNAEMYGPSVPAYISPYMGGHRKPRARGPLDGDRRRSIYLEVRRNFLSPFLMAFDFPAPDSTHGRRNVSNVPAQSLVLLNDPFVAEQAKSWGERIAAEDGDGLARIVRMYLSAFGRTPGIAEMEHILGFFERQSAAYGISTDEALADPRIWTELAHTLFMAKEFIFLR